MLFVVCLSIVLGTISLLIVQRRKKKQKSATLKIKIRTKIVNIQNIFQKKFYDFNQKINKIKKT